MSDAGQASMLVTPAELAPGFRLEQPLGNDVIPYTEYLISRYVIAERIASLLSSESTHCSQESGPRLQMWFERMVDSNPTAEVKFQEQLKKTEDMLDREGYLAI
jgi:hypothetical protein